MSKDISNEINEYHRKYWPSAVMGNFTDPEKGLIFFWTGEKLGRIAVSFHFKNQPQEESKKVFFIEVNSNGWALRHISTFKLINSEMKLIKNQSFKLQDYLENKYKSIIEKFLKERKSKSKL